MAQWIRHRPPKPGIGGSSPPSGWWHNLISQIHITFNMKRLYADVYTDIFISLCIYIYRGSSLSYSTVSWCSGYHICFTRRRPRVRSSLKPLSEYWFFSSTLYIWIQCLQPICQIQLSWISQMCHKMQWVHLIHVRAQVKKHSSQV